VPPSIKEDNATLYFLYHSSSFLRLKRHVESCEENKSLKPPYAAFCKCALAQFLSHNCDAVGTNTKSKLNQNVSRQGNLLTILLRLLIFTK
jgi:hypothetical protein